METKTEINLSEQITRLVAESEAVKKEAVTYLVDKGVVLDLTTEWLTQKEYCKKFGIANVQTVNNWISRGIIPPENIRTIPELNNLRLIKGVPYHE